MCIFKYLGPIPLSINLFFQQVSPDLNFDYVKSAAEQARGRYEMAAENYKSIMEKPALDSHVHAFVCDQTVNCYKELNNWSDIIRWYNVDSSENGTKHNFSTVNLDFAKVLAETEADPTEAFTRLSSWDDNENQSWSIYEMFRKTESNLYNVALNASTADSNIHKSLEV